MGSNRSSRDRSKRSRSNSKISRSIIYWSRSTSNNNRRKCRSIRCLTPGRGEGGGLRAGVGAGALRVKSWGPPSWGGPGKGAPSWGAATLGPGAASRGAVGASCSPSTRATSLLNIFMHSGGGDEEGARGTAGGGGGSQGCMGWDSTALQPEIGLKLDHWNCCFGCWTTRFLLC